MMHSLILSLLCTQEKGWREAVLETGFQDKVSSQLMFICEVSFSMTAMIINTNQTVFCQVDSRLKSLNATFRVKNPDK